MNDGISKVQGATHRLSRLMGRCEGAFDGICLDDRGAERIQRKGVERLTEDHCFMIYCSHSSYSDYIHKCDVVVLLCRLVRLKEVS